MKLSEMILQLQFIKDNRWDLDIKEIEVKDDNFDDIYLAFEWNKYSEKKIVFQEYLPF